MMPRATVMMPGEWQDVTYIRHYCHLRRLPPFVMLGM